MRTDHIAFRVAQGKRDEAIRFFVDAFGYKVQGEPFEIYFNDEKTDKAMCVALEPPEKISKSMPWEAYHIMPPPPMPKIVDLSLRGIFEWTKNTWQRFKVGGIYYLAQELFISEGTEESIVGKWVKSRNGVGGVHHIAFQTVDVETTMKRFQDNGWAKFTSDKPVTCPGITQVFSEENCTGVVFEFIRRDGPVGFCSSNVAALMRASAVKGD